MRRNSITNPEIPLCINVLRLLSYKLAPDELIMFDWLVVKQIAFNYKPFHYSQSRVEEETRIHRIRQEAIIKLFTSLGFLTTEIKINSVTRGRVRYYSVNFKLLSDSDILQEIIRPETTLFHDFRVYFDFHAKQQKKSKSEELKPADKINHEAANRIYKLLNETYEARRIYYNDGGMTSKKPERTKSEIQLQRNKPIDRKMAKLAERYNDNSIENSFIAYVDDILRGNKKPDNLMYYFLSYEEVLDSFGIFDHYLNIFTLKYSCH